jgi:hypothetical protein
MNPMHNTANDNTRNPTLISNMTYHIRESNKIDQQRCGGTMLLEVVDESDPDVAFCVITNVLRLARDAQPTGEAVFLSYTTSGE